MNNRFRRTRAGVEVRFGTVEAAALTRLLTELVSLLDDTGGAARSDDPLEALMAGADTERERPDDPVLARLLPDAYDDGEAAAEYRRLTEGDLRAGKVAAARTALATLEMAAGQKLLLDDEQAQAWLSAINDLRLSLGTRYEVTEDTYDEMDSMAADDPRLPPLSAYLWLGALEETLVHALADW